MTHANNREISRRTDGEKTKARIISEAMRLTAEKGYNGVTSKEICEASGVNTALVSYYFGSKKLLHEEVLKRAHDELFSMEEILRIFALPVSAEEKLKKFLQYLFKREKNNTELQAIKIFLWEIRSPSEALKASLVRTVLPKLSLLLEVASQISGLPVDSSELRRIMFLVVTPCFIAMMFPPMIIETLFNIESTSNDKFINYLWQNCLRALKTARDEVKKEAKPLGENDCGTNLVGAEGSAPITVQTLETILKSK